MDLSLIAPDCIYTEKFTESVSATSKAIFGQGLQPEFTVKSLSPFAIQLPKFILNQIEDVTSLLETELYNTPLIHLSESRQELIEKVKTYPSVLMAYDFHFDSTNKKVKLIEVNTNGSGYILCEILAQMVQAVGIDSQNLKSLWFSFQKSFDIWNISNSVLRNIAIVDEEVQNQFMFPELLLYKRFIESNDVKCSILDFDRLNFSNGKAYDLDKEEVQFIYNRYTDFEFSRPKSSQLRSAYLNHICCISPHPVDYIYQADKTRLIDLLKNESCPERLKQHLLFSQTSDTFGDIEEIWKLRKKLFFKPPTSHGSKGVYRGNSISRKKFEEILKSKILVQEFLPPDKAYYEGDEWKYDIRAFVFGGKVQLCAARVFKGQVTNFRTERSGFSHIHWI
ncbi:MAG: hypothetical protein R2827_06515 [Bdellovibrionales bacterium]